MVEFTIEAIQSWTFVCWRYFFITDSITLIVIGLFRFIISSWFSLGRLHVSRNLSISSKLYYLLVYNCYCSLMIFCISVVSVVTFLSFLVVFIWALSLAEIKACLFYLLSKKQLLISLILSNFCHVFLLWSLLFLFFYCGWALFGLLFLVFLGEYWLSI